MQEEIFGDLKNRSYSDEWLDVTDPKDFSVLDLEGRQQRD